MVCLPQPGDFVRHVGADENLLVLRRAGRDVILSDNTRAQGAELDLVIPRPINRHSAWITAKFRSTCADCGGEILAGDETRWYPLTRRCLCVACGAKR